jgi:hypothetical protein
MAFAIRKKKLWPKNIRASDVGPAKSAGTSSRDNEI